MGRNEDLVGYRHIWLPSLGYPLTAWGLHDKQNQVEKNAVDAFLPKIGFSTPQNYYYYIVVLYSWQPELAQSDSVCVR
jgi:hypothetical protein